MAINSEVARVWWREPCYAVPLALLPVRLLSIMALYTLPTPNGGTVVEIAWKFTRVAVAAEICALLLAAAILRLIPSSSRWVQRGVLAFVFLGLLLCEIDAVLRRFMGLRLGLGFVRRFFASAHEAGFWEGSVRGLSLDPVGTLLLFGLPLLGTFLVWALWKPEISSNPRRRPVEAAWLLAAALAALGLSILFESASRKWRLAAPATFGLALDIVRGVATSDNPEDPARALTILRALAGGGGPDPKYPLWRPALDEAGSIAAFRARPLAERPNVILIAIESLRGWVLDWRSPRARHLAPNLWALWQRSGVAFVRSHSNGFPSGEGNLNLNLGIWSHPRRAVLAELVDLRSRALPEILGEVGYRRIWLTGTDPSFDNLQTWTQRWHERSLFAPGTGIDSQWLADDRVLFRRAAEEAQLVPIEQPLYLSVYTGTTHTPYRVPGEAAIDGSDAAYERALSYCDRAIGELFASLERLGRLEQAIIVVTGDHAQPTASQISDEAALGMPHTGHTWSGLLVAAPGVAGGSIRLDEASHVDVAPTILGRLRLDVSNHFVGRDLLASDHRGAALALTYGGIAWSEEGEMIGASLDDDSIRVRRYDEGPHDAGAYGGGTALVESPRHRDLARRLQEAARAWGQLLDEDRLRPPRDPSDR